MPGQIPHLVELGVTAVELLPVFEYDELEFQRSPNPRDHMVNIWGYSHLSFFAPMSRFGTLPVPLTPESLRRAQSTHHHPVYLHLSFCAPASTLEILEP